MVRMGHARGDQGRSTLGFSGDKVLIAVGRKPFKTVLDSRALECPRFERVGLRWMTVLHVPVSRWGCDHWPMLAT